MNLPNKLTIARIFLTFVFLFFIAQEGFIAMFMAAFIFSLASLTDFFDGYIAKKYHLTSDFGKLMDPIADKFLILAAFLAFLRLQLVMEWMVLLILGREFIITGLRLLAMKKGKVLAAERMGKNKTVSQILAIFTILGFLVFREYFSSTGQWSYAIESWWRRSIDILMFITVALTLISGGSYLWNNRKLIHG